MLVYGDHYEVADPGERMRALSERLSAVRAMPSGIARHAKLVGALLQAGQMAQGVADVGADTAQLDRFLYLLARCSIQSFDSRFEHIGRLPEPPTLTLAGKVVLRLPEGFAFYAVYPETYAVAARRLNFHGPPRVIGIRSIGTTLGAVVAAALNAPPAMTVRPQGDPFARQVDLPPELIDDGSHFVIVDEGPGLSGSSFGAVADALEARGVPLERIAFLPSHDGYLGPQASTAHRDRWRRAQRVAAEFDPYFLEVRFGPLESFWTGHAGERPKYLAGSGENRLLIKFAGLGSIGERKLHMARRLHAAGLSPEPLGLVHGFIVERWWTGAQRLGQHEKPIDEIGHYIGARAQLFPAADDSGATLAELHQMAKRNVALALGAVAARSLDRWDVNRLAPLAARANTDNKLDREKWLRLPDGRLLKCDALDHHQAHDLIGCQDAAWDVAGAIVEFDLDDSERRLLVCATRLCIDPDLLDFYLLAYPAFRLGEAQLSCADTAPYHTALQHLLHQRQGGETAEILV